MTASARACDATAFEALAALLAYPRPDYRARLAACREALRTGGADAIGHLEAFASRVDGLTLEQLQERFTGTFDLNPACTLDVGWHLFGEQYERGAFLVEMREALRAHGVPESVELADHLTHLLMLLGRLDGARAADLASRALEPALERVLSSLAGTGNPFEPLLRATSVMVAHAGTPSS
ncbi:MAG: molecular chaperone TorD family protein [Acidobacteria bacterium]|nr:molecular chaperone TorD family protein [Acidobacteriota bacterium]